MGERDLPGGAREGAAGIHHAHAQRLPLARDPDAEETAAAEIYFWDPERLGECIGEHVEDGLEWLCKDGRLVVASGDFCAGALTEMAHSSADACVKVWMIIPSGLVRWCTFPAENRVTFQLLLLGDLLVCSARVGADPALAINSVSQRATLRTVISRAIGDRSASSACQGAASSACLRRDGQHSHLLDGRAYRRLRRGLVGVRRAARVSASLSLHTGARASKLLVHELSGIW